jgi:hypothetical protein
LHYLVPAGGLASDGKTWLAARQKFLLPVKALARIFRAKMRQALRKVDVEGLISPDVWRQNWVVHCKAVGCGQLALKYLAPYIFRVAISNRRILKLEDERVTFRFRATDTGQEKLCTLAAEEFIRRFLQHILPKGFVKVRYYGFFSSGSRPRLAVIRQQLGQDSIFVDDVQSDQVEKAASVLETVHRCPVCGCPMQAGDPILPAKGRKGSLSPRNGSPMSRLWLSDASWRPDPACQRTVSTMRDRCCSGTCLFQSTVSELRSSGLMIPGGANGSPRGSRFRSAVDCKVGTRNKRASRLPVGERRLGEANSHQFPSRL